MVSKYVLAVTGIAIVLLLGVGVYFMLPFFRPSLTSTPTATPSPTTIAIPSPEPRYEVTSEEVVYYQSTSGYLSKPTESGKYPGVVMIHEWWGLTDNIKSTTQQLASEGYVVLAVDLYDGEVARTPERARELVSKINQDEALRNMISAVNLLKSREGVRKIASLGWCFGGGQSLQLALSGEQLDATVIYYGTLVTDETRLSRIKWPVLGIFGDKDQSIPVTTVNEFASTLDRLGIKNEIYIYPGVGHAFANPSGENYAPNETKDAWGKTMSFLDRYLK